MATQTAPDVGLDLRQAISGTAPAGPAEGLDLLPAVTYGPPPPEPPGPFKRGVKAGTAGVKSAAYGFGALAARGAANVLPAPAAQIATGLEQAALENVAAQNEIAAQGAITYEDVVADPTRLGEFLKYSAGSAGPSLATMAVGGGVGAGVGALAARKTAATLAARALGATAPAVKTGALVGAVAPDFAIEAGSIYPEALETGVENPALRSVAGGAGAAAIDFLTLPTAVRALMPAAGAVTRKAGTKAALGAAARGAVTTGAKVGGAEGAQELTQTFIERLAAGKDLTGPEAVSDYINSTLTGLIAGTAIGGPVGGFRGATAPIERAPEISSSVATAPEQVQPEPVSPTPEAVHADLTARHAAATANLATLELAVAQAQQEHDALVAKREALNAESKLELGQRRTKSEITKEKKALAEQVKKAKAKIEDVGGQLFAARTAVADLTAQIGSQTAEMQGTAPVQTLGTSEQIPPTERRTNMDLRTRFEAMTPEERATALSELQQKAYTSDLTGLPNKRAFDEQVAATPDAQVLYSDVDGLKALNTKYGHDGADQILRTVGDVKAAVAQEMGINAFHRSGDEFLATHTDPAALEAYGKEVQQRLANTTVEVKKPDGTTEKQVGIGISYGVAADAKQAEVAANAQKTERTQTTTARAVEGARIAAGALPNKTQTGGVTAPATDTVGGLEALQTSAPAPTPAQPGIARKKAREVRALIDQTGVTSLNQTEDELVKLIEEKGIAAADKTIAGLKKSLASQAKITGYRGKGATAIPAPLATDLRGYLAEVIAAKKIPEKQKIAHAEQIDKAITDITSEAAVMPANLRPTFIQVEVKKRIEGMLGASAKGEVIDHITKMVEGTQQSTAGTSRAALTQEEFETLPQEAQSAAMDAYSAVMRQKGMALRTRLAQLIGDRPELKVMTFSAEPGGAIGSYTRVGPYKAAISMALNAKEGLSVADHEGYHFAEDWLLSTSEKAIVKNAMKPGKPLFEALKAKLQQYDRENGTNVTDEVTSKSAEARAYGFEFWRRGELKAEGHLARIWQKLQQFFERISNAVKGLGFQSIEDVFTALDRGQFAERQMVDPGERVAMESRAGEQGWYRSMLTEAVAGIVSKQASAQGWKDQIKGLIAKGAAKQAEIEATGLNDWLDLQQGKVTKDQVMAFLGENGVQVQEVVLGGLGEKAALPPNEADELRMLREEYDAGLSTLSESDIARLRELTARDAAALRNETKFSSYQLPGGENYRELLLTLPFKNEPLTTTEKAERDSLHEYLQYAGTEDPLMREKQARFTELDTRFRGASSIHTTAFKSSHYDQPNILAHVRFNERTDAEGKRVLFLEELQSDWAQKGRKEGFSGQTKIEKREDGGWAAHEAEALGIEKNAPAWVVRDAQGKEVGKYYKESYAVAAAKEEGKIPAAPFVTKTEAWTALALKRMIRYAAENGFDKIAWTTGEQQAERYDLSKQIKEIDYIKRGDKYEIAFTDNNGGGHNPGTFSAAELPDVVGKEVAQKIIDGEGKSYRGRESRTLEGLDLKVGGEGMKGYYDKIVPSVANDVLKKLGGGKVEEISIDQKGDFSAKVGAPDEVWPYEIRVGDRVVNRVGTLEIAELEVADLRSRGRDATIVKAKDTTSTQPGFTLTPTMAEHAANGLPLFSKAAVEKANLYQEGQLEAMQTNEQWAKYIETADAPRDVWARLFGIAKDDIAGGLGRWWTNQMSTPNFISASSKGFKNVYQAFNTYSRYRKILSEQLVREKLPGWYKASDADRKATFDVMLKRTVNGYSASSQELAELLRPLTTAQTALYNQATGMIAGVLKRQFESQKATRKLQLTSEGAYDKWLARRQEQMDALLDKGYVPLRRYGDYSVAVFMETPDGSRPKASLEFFSSQSAANEAAAIYAKEIERSGVALKVELGRRSKNERDTGVSLEQFLGTLRRQGIDISQAERERLVVAMTNTESLVRTQMMHREGLAGYSTDGMRVLHEFGVNTTSEIAYARFAPVLDAALDGAEVVADVDSVTSEPVITIGESFGKREDGVPNNLWEQDGPQSGFYKDRANAMADTTLVPNRQGEWATRLRTAGVMYFIGGSLSGAAVNTLSIPMLLVPRLSIHTDYLNATTTSLKAWKDSWQYYNILRDMDRMKNPDAEIAAKLDAAGITKEMRAAIVAAADHIFDTEIHMMLGISQGTLYSKSRNMQRAAEAWMTPFRVAEQTNRLASFMAAYKIASDKNFAKADGTKGALAGQELFRFSSEMVDATQNNYNVNNRPGIMNNPVGALMFQFKSFPLFVIEAAALMYKQSPKSAVYMLLGLTAMAGVQGLPFAEEILNLVDVISQRIFGSPFNSRRAMRNVIKSASEMIGVVDLSDAVMRGMVNEITGVGIATRVSGGLLPGTRIGAADATEGRVLSEIAGAPYSMVQDTMSNVGGFVSGVATGNWMKAADAIRAGGPIALRNLVKGAEQLSSGYASDSRGQKVTDVSTLDGLLQLTGLSSAKVTNMQDHNSIVIQVKAFHTQVSQDMQKQLVEAYRSGDTEKQAEIMDFASKWNAQYPNMPVLPNASAVRRAIMLADVPLDRRAQMLLGRRMRGEFGDILDEE